MNIEKGIRDWMNDILVVGRHPSAIYLGYNQIRELRECFYDKEVTSKQYLDGGDERIRICGVNVYEVKELDHFNIA